MFLVPNSLFPLGRLVATRTISVLMEESREFHSEIQTCIAKYVQCDWGDELSDGDKRLNDSAVKKRDDRILASYHTSKGQVWIETDWQCDDVDEPITIIMFPSEC